MNNALINVAGEGHSGADSNTSGNASIIANALSKAPSPKAIKMLVARKKTASSISRLLISVTPSFVPDSIDHVPRRRAPSSTAQRYNVVRLIGRRVLVQGRVTMKRPPRLHVRRAKGQAQTRIRPMYVPGPPLETSQSPSRARYKINPWISLCTLWRIREGGARYSACSRGLFTRW